MMEKAFLSSEEIGKDDRVVYIETLANADDYWLSITDAARVCRVQDVSIRRAINKGILPVRSQRAGLNKRTRFVRASDLPGAGFPIIDQSAAITTEIGKADVLSIPRQQQQIMQEHQQLTTSMLAMQETLAQEQKQVLERFQQQEAQFQRALQVWQAQTTQQFAIHEALLKEQQEQFQRDLAVAEHQQAEKHQATHRQLEQLALELQQQATHTEESLHLQQEAFHTQLRAQDTTFQAYQGEIKQALEELVTTQRSALLAHQQTVNAQIQQNVQEVQRQIALCQQNVADSLERSLQWIRAQFSSLEASQQTIEGQLTALTTRTSLQQQASEALSQRLTNQHLEWERAVQQQKVQNQRYEQLLPLLPYTGQALATEESIAQLRLDMETRERDAQSLLAFLLVPERLARLKRLLADDHE